MEWTSYNPQNIKEKYLYKFLSKSNLDRFLQTGSLWFSRSDKFGDKMECIKISDLIKDRLDFKEINSNKRKTLISCWHSANNETLAFWDTYAEEIKDRKNFAVRFNREVLISLV